MKPAIFSNPKSRVSETNLCTHREVRECSCTAHPGSLGRNPWVKGRSSCAVRKGYIQNAQLFESIPCS